MKYFIIFSHPEFREIIVSAEGRVFGRPDVVLLNSDLKSKVWSIQEVVKDDTDKINSILAEIENLGIEDN